MTRVTRPVAFRDAAEADVPAVVALLRDDALGALRETGDLPTYLAAFRAIRADPASRLVVGEDAGRVVATYQITVLHGLSLSAARRAQVEAVRVAADLRSQGIGARLMADAEARAKAAGCTLVQLTSNAGRVRAHAFYARLGYAPSHTGFKKAL